MSTKYNRSILLTQLAALIIFVMLLVQITPGVSQTVFEGDVVSEEMSSALSQEILRSHPDAVENGMVLTVLGTSDNWTFGTIGIRAPEIEHSGPTGLIFLAKHSSNSIKVSLGYTQTFNEWLPLVPDSVISKEAKLFLGGPGLSPDGDGSAYLSVPWRIREEWRMTWGPHTWNGSNTGPWSAIDFNLAPGVNGTVTASREGLVLRPCDNFIIIVHGNGWETGYYHVRDIGVSQNQVVTRGRTLGGTSTQTGCGGSATGIHVHFTLRRYGQYVDIGNKDIGGWNVRKGSTQGSGHLIKNGIWKAVNQHVWNDGGIGSACPLNQMQGTYYNNKTLSGNPTFWRCEYTPFYDWGANGPGNGLGVDNFSVRWAGQYTYSGNVYRIMTRTDDGVRLWLDSSLLYNRWFDQGATTYFVYRSVSGTHTPMMEYYENGGDAVAQLVMATNLAQNRPASATSQQSPSYPPQNGNDGNRNTRWSSSSTGSDEWWVVDLGSATFNKVIIRWEAAYAVQHFIGSSDDGITFTGRWFTIPNAGDWVYTLSERTSRYLGIKMTTRAPCCGNFSFWETEIYRTFGLNIDNDPYNAEIISDKEVIEVIKSQEDISIIR